MCVCHVVIKVFNSPECLNTLAGEMKHYQHTLTYTVYMVCVCVCVCVYVCVYVMSVCNIVHVRV